MRLSEIFNQLSFGELSRLALGNHKDTGIRQEDWEEIVAHINLGLTELYKRFPLRTQEVIVQQYDHIQTYYLNSEYAATNTASTQPYKYIDDSQYEPFLDNVLRIEKVFNEEGQELFVNDDSEYWSVHTPSYNSVMIPYPDSANAMSIIYRADHDPIVLGNKQPDEIEVDLPPSYLEALLAYVGYRAHAGIKSIEGVNASADNLSKFETSCARITQLHLVQTSNTTNLKLESNGWV